MTAVNGSLRWIITPGKGKVSFLSPLEPQDGFDFVLAPEPDYLNKGEELIHAALFKGKSEYVISLQERGMHSIYFDGRPVSRSAKRFLSPRMSPQGDVGVFAFEEKWVFFLNGKRDFEVDGEVNSWLFAGKMKQKLPAGFEPVRAAVNNEERVAVETVAGGKNVVFLEGRQASLREAQAIGAWQFAPDGRLVIAQKIDGKWGVYSGSKKISPEAAMVWGWQDAHDGSFIVPVEFSKGDRLVLLKDGSVAYAGKGDLLTWHYEAGRLWVLALENGAYKLYCNGSTAGELGSKQILKSWQASPSGKVAFEYAAGSAGETPRTCHPSLIRLLQTSGGSLRQSQAASQ
jgi:hypothetical protein